MAQQRLFPFIVNRDSFIIDKHADYWPMSAEWIDYWREEKKRCIEGWWVEEIAGSWRYMPPTLYFMINHWKIMLGGENVAGRKIGRPHLRDVEWIIHCDWQCSRGFSGFQHGKYTSNLLVKKWWQVQNEELDSEGVPFRITPIEQKKLDSFDYIKDDSGNYKQYKHPFDILKESYKKPLGLPLYQNETTDYLLLSARGLSKSVCAGVIAGHDVTFDGARYYNSELDTGEKGASEIFVGAPSTDKMKNLLGYIDLGLNNLEGTFEKDGQFENPPFSKKWLGSWSKDKGQIDNVYYQLQNGKRVPKTTGTTIAYGTFTVANPNAAVSKRRTIIFTDEVGLVTNIEEVLSNNVNVLMDGGVKFGINYMTGCVCAGTKVWTKSGNLVNIEDLQESDGIIGYNEETQEYSTQDINFINPPSIKPCYRIKTSAGREIECSEDHPILKRIVTHYTKGCHIKKPEFVPASELEVGDKVAAICGVDVWGEREVEDAYLIGMLIGDGSYGTSKSYYERVDGTITESNCLSVKLMNADAEVWEYVESKYGVSDYHDPSPTKDDRILRKCGITGVHHMIDDAGIRGQVKDKKRLPTYTHELTKEQACELIAGFFDADGCAYFNLKDRYSTIKFTAAGEDLLKDLQLVLNKLGVNGSIRKEFSKPNKLVKTESTFYSLYVKDRNSIIRFCQNVKSKLPYKQEKLDQMLEFNLGKDRKYREDGIRWEKIVEKEFIGDREIYNLNAGPDHTYLANGFVTHNTGGEFEKTESVQRIFNNPEEHGILAFPDIWENRGNIGRFIPAEYSLKDYKDENGNTLLEEAREVLEAERRKLMGGDSQIALLKKKMFMPLVPSEMFISKNSNLFPTELLQRQLPKAIDNYDENTSLGWLEYVGEGRQSVKWVPHMGGDRKPIKRMNTDSLIDLRGVLEVFEHPPENLPPPSTWNALYKITYDPVKDDMGGSSLASIIVWKGFSAENWEQGKKDLIVAKWIGRFESTYDIHEVAIKLAMYYNAKVFPELDVPEFYKWCSKEGLLRYLQPCLRGLENKYGYGLILGQARNSINREAELAWKKVLIEERPNDNEDNGKVYNLDYIYSPRILEELIAYNRDDNFDDVSALKLLGLWLASERGEPVDNKERESKKVFKQLKALISQ